MRIVDPFLIGRLGWPSRAADRRIVPRPSYVQVSWRTGLDLFAGVVPLPESFAAYRPAGLSGTAIIAPRGPFSVDENRAMI